jgi:hypothetical protein
MAKKPTHYRVTVNRPIEVAGITFKPGARYTVKAAVHNEIKQTHAAAVVTADPIITE